MAKYSEKLVEKMVSLIEEDIYTVSEICNMLHISRKTFYEWKTTKPEFAQAIEDAEDRRDDKLVMMARWSLQKKIEGYTTTHITETYVPDKCSPQGEKLVKRVVTKKQCAPDVKAIKLVLSRNDAKKERQRRIQPSTRPFIINVKDQETKEVVEKLREKIKKGKDFVLPATDENDSQLGS